MDAVKLMAARYFSCLCWQPEKGSRSKLSQMEVMKKTRLQSYQNYLKMVQAYKFSLILYPIKRSLKVKLKAAWLLI